MKFFLEMVSEENEAKNKKKWKKILINESTIKYKGIR